MHLNRIALGIEYNGSAYNGWQCQKHGLGVQEVVEKALSFVANEPVKVVCAGRTDSGVHAAGQVVHFDSQVIRDDRAWLMGTNSRLPDNIAVNWAKPVTEEFHARFSALKRYYRYVIANQPVRPAILDRLVSWDYRRLDVSRMQTAANYLLGEHDFSSYRAIKCQAKNPVRTIYRLEVSRCGDYIFIDIEANAFLHHMVRNIAGVLMAIGAGEKAEQWAGEVLGYRDRTLGGITAPPNGLYFMQVTYPEVFAIPNTVAEGLFP
ncbi:tRNA pseudouridine(38-40) synthase TruA [Sulfuriflexus mobilis]|uniref:tRNA pseudouridine(38-40) synthase TruA n=1 Tax=Sulfuriflexus mobilis TaxID=1811807 RepID=UPI000F82827F